MCDVAQLARRARRDSVCSALRPILPRPSARIVPSCFLLWPIVLRTWVTFTVLMREPLRDPPAARPLRRQPRRPPRPWPRRSRAAAAAPRLIVLPRCRATSSGRRRFLSPSTVAFAMLIGFVVPRLLASTSRMPASSSTARTPPPAMTPVPSLAGRRNTRAAPNWPRISCVIVVPCFGTVNRFFFASSTAFEMASGTSRAFP